MYIYLYIYMRALTICLHINDIDIILYNKY